MTQDILFSPYQLSQDLILKNRIVMAPMSRCMATDDFIPTPEMADYYARRASTGLIITECTMISPTAQGYPNSPAIFNQEHVAGWKQVTQKVHENGGKIFAQLWHTGRVSHSIYLNGNKPLAPSAVGLTGRVKRTDNLQYEEPKEMTPSDIQTVINDFAKAAKYAKEAGFDGVEIHAANGYLLDQFLHWDTNRRNDHWGESPENMSRILFDVINAVKQQIQFVGVRLSPVAYLNIEHDDRDKPVFDYVLEQLNQYDLAYVHTGMFDDSYQDHLKSTVTHYIRQHYHGSVIACGGYNSESAREALLNNDADLVAIGRPLIPNPDYVEKTRQNKKLTPYDVSMLNTLV